MVKEVAGKEVIKINPLAWGLVAVLLITGLGTLVFAQEKGEENKVLGGPVNNSNEGYLISQEVVYGESIPSPETNNEEGKDSSPRLTNLAEVLSDDNPLKPFLSISGNVFIYTIQWGDTVEEIAKRFGITADTIRQANNLSSDRLIAGHKLTVPPTTGVLHRLEQGETPESVAYDYQADPKRIRNANAIIAPGVIIIVPDGICQDSTQRMTGYRLPNLVGYFSQPATGINWGRLHQNNAVDIANVCGTAITAAANGVVIEEKSSGWNEGYGTYLVIEHPNGTETLYAHNSKNLKAVGDIVEQGEKIAIMGNSGNVKGVTGCHLHFEVHGAVNPFAR